MLILFLVVNLFYGESRDFYVKSSISKEFLCRYMVGCYFYDSFYWGKEIIRTASYPPPDVKRIKSYEETPPYIKYRNYEIILSSEIEGKIAEYDFDFKPYNIENYTLGLVSLYPFSPYSAPSTIVGDFNGDGKKDVIMDGENRNFIKRIVVISNESGYRVIEIFKVEKKQTKNKTVRNFGILLQPKGSIYYSQSDMNRSGEYNTDTLFTDGYAQVRAEEEYLVIEMITYYDTKSGEWTNIGPCSYKGCYYSGMYYVPKEDHEYINWE